MQRFSNKMPSLHNLNALVYPMMKCVFDIHDSMGIRYIIQLRFGLSPLINYKRRNGFLETLSDRCSCYIGTEDTIGT